MTRAPPSRLLCMQHILPRQSPVMAHSPTEPVTAVGNCTHAHLEKCNKHKDFTFYQLNFSLSPCGTIRGEMRAPLYLKCPGA